MSTVKVNAAQIGQSITATNNFTVYQPASPDGTVRWGVGNAGSVTDLVVLNSSGNLGLGVTPSAWWTGTSAWRAMNIGQGASLSSRASTEVMYLSSNWYFDGTEKYIAAGNATQYMMNAGQHIWKTATSGTAGNPISFTQAMTLDANGNLGIGTSSPFVSSGFNGLSLNGSTGSLLYMYYGGTRGMGGYVTSAGGVFGTVASIPLIFTTVDNERMRIDSSGNLLVGTTTATARVTVVGDGNVLIAKRTTAGGIAEFQNGSDAGYGISLKNASGGVAGSIYWNATTTTYATSSDYRLKENIQPMQNALAVVQQLNPVTYTWKVDGSDGQGFIAHELQEVIKDAVTGEKDAVDAEGNPVYQGIDTSFLVATLTKAIQELEARVKQLEAK